MRRAIPIFVSIVAFCLAGCDDQPTQKLRESSSSAAAPADSWQVQRSRGSAGPVFAKKRPGELWDWTHLLAHLEKSSLPVFASRYSEEVGSLTFDKYATSKMDVKVRGARDEQVIQINKYRCREEAIEEFERSVSSEVFLPVPEYYLLWGTFVFHARSEKKYIDLVDRALP
jgi:hypothetical protein